MTGLIIRVEIYWVHKTCVNWIKGVHFVLDKQNNEKGIRRIKEALRSQNKYKCHICLKTEGVCIKCDTKSCVKRFHVRCGWSIGLIIEKEKMEYNPKDEFGVSIFCFEHRVSHLKKDLKTD